VIVSSMLVPPLTAYWNARVERRKRNTGQGGR
jgi:hypothetical protein